MRYSRTITNAADEIFFGSPFIVNQSHYSSASSRGFSGGVYLVTEVPSSNFTSISAIAQFSIGYHQHSFAPQHIVISLANEMFKGSKPMVGEELEILRRTYKRLLRNTPTSFRK